MIDLQKRTVNNSTFVVPVSDYEPTRFDFPKHQIGENGAGGLLQKHRSGGLRIESGGLIP